MLTESVIFAMLVRSWAILFHLKKRTPVYIRVSEGSLVSHARFSPTVNRWINSFDTSLLMAYMGLPVDSSTVTSSYAGLDTCVSLSRYEILTVLFTPSRGWIVCQIWVEETWEIKSDIEIWLRGNMFVPPPPQPAQPRAGLKSCACKKKHFCFWKDLNDWKKLEGLEWHFTPHRDT